MEREAVYTQRACWYATCRDGSHKSCRLGPTLEKLHRYAEELLQKLRIYETGQVWKTDKIMDGGEIDLQETEREKKYITQYPTAKRKRDKSAVSEVCTCNKLILCSRGDFGFASWTESSREPISPTTLENFFFPFVWIDRPSCLEVMVIIKTEEGHSMRRLVPSFGWYL